MARNISFQDITWFLDLNDKGQINLDPPYQRRSVWSPRDRRYFIDTILNDYPAPPVFLHKTLDENGRPTYHVVDGKQRIQTIFGFTKDKIRIPDDFGITALQGKRWRDLDRSVREKFWNYIIIVETLPDASEASIRSTFERINRNSRKLSPQELRHAKYDGWFATTAESEAEKQEWRDIGIVTTARSKRMLDVQFISELMQITIKRKLIGFDQDALDALYADYEETDEIESFDEELFSAEISAIRDYIKQIVFYVPEVAPLLRIQMNLYSLWGYLSAPANRQEAPGEFGARYKAFHDAVQSRLANPVAVDTNEPPANPAFFRAVEAYADNARGASTDIAQRRARHKALVAAMGGVEPFPDEGQ
jgi:hypothetical protein